MTLPEIVIGSKDPVISRRVSSWQKEGLLRPLLPRVYTSNFSDPNEQIVLRNIWPLLSHLYPKTLLSFRSALSFQPSAKNRLYLTGGYNRVLQWPGLELRFHPGPGPLEDDNPLYDQLYVSSLERACLENLLRSRSIKGENRAADQSVIEQRLIQILDLEGEDGLNKFRDRARSISEQLEWDDAMKKLNKIISALLSSHPSSVLKSPGAKAVGLGKPYDSGRLELFQTLIAELLKQSFPSLAEKTNSQVAYQNLAFFESYFSNYIEGTVFTVAEARDIIFKNIRIPNRTGDSHDISGTYEVCAFRERLEQEAKEPNDFLALIESHHSEVMRGRPDKRPGKFKIRANRAGSTYFVDPNKVIGSLEQAFVLLRGIKSPFARATFVMFALSEIHPFTDGNGRLARIMMNAELSRAGESKIIIPTVYRADYMLNLRKLTRDKDPAPYVRMMYRIWQWTHWLEPDNLGSMEAQLIGCNAFLHDDEGAIIFPEGI